jgi:hypothetical protein
MERRRQSAAEWSSAAACVGGIARCLQTPAWQAAYAQRANMQTARNVLIAT